MKLQDFEFGIASFIDKKIAPVLTSDMDKWMLYAGLTAGSPVVQKRLIPMMKSLQIIDESGQIDMDRLKAAAKAAFARQPKIKIWKLTFSEKDFDSLMQFLNAGPPPPQTTEINL